MSNSGNFDTVTANKVVSNEIDANQIYAQTFGGRGGGGAIIVADKILLGGWLLESTGDGIYVTTPDGIRTKMELIDFRQTPVPATAKLQLEPAQTSVLLPASTTSTV